MTLVPKCDGKMNEQTHVRTNERTNGKVVYITRHTSYGTRIKNETYGYGNQKSLNKRAIWP